MTAAADNYGFGTVKRRSYNRRHLKVIEHEFLNSIRDVGIGQLTWMAENLARSSQNRLHTHLNISGETGNIKVGRRGTIVYAWTEDKSWSCRVNDEIMTMARGNAFKAEYVNRAATDAPLKSELQRSFEKVWEKHLAESDNLPPVTPPLTGDELIAMRLKAIKEWKERKALQESEE